VDPVAGLQQGVGHLAGGDLYRKTFHRRVVGLAIQQRLRVRRHAGIASPHARDPWQYAAGRVQQSPRGKQQRLVGQFGMPHPHQHRVRVVRHERQGRAIPRHPDALAQGLVQARVLQPELAEDAVEAGVGKWKFFHRDAGMERDAGMRNGLVPGGRQRCQVHRIDLQPGQPVARFPQPQWQRAVAGGQVQHACIGGHGVHDAVPEAADRAAVAGIKTSRA